MAPLQHFSLYGLWYAMERRIFDNVQLPSLNLPIDETIFKQITEKACFAERALKHRPVVLPPDLSHRIVTALTQIQAEAEFLDKEIELNLFRLKRRSPKARPEAQLGVWRQELVSRWNLVLDGLIVEIARFWDEHQEWEKRQKRARGNKL